MQTHTSPSTLNSALDEFGLIQRYFTFPTQHAVLGVGDDCALLSVPAQQTLAITSDMLIEGRHFFPDANARQLGHKALAVNLSDLAAMAAKPYAFTLALALPYMDEAWLADFSKGMIALAERYQCELIGGDTTRGPLAISITALGYLPLNQALRRDQAQIDDDIWVSGELGDARLALGLLRGEWAQELVLDTAQCAQTSTRLHQPQPRVELGLALRGIAHAAIDISDGLVSDLGHILSRSHCGAALYLSQLPASSTLACQSQSIRHHCILAGGDDYELCFTAPVGARDQLNALSQSLDLRLTRIGKIEAEMGLRLFDDETRHAPLLDMTQFRGFNHFAS